MISLSAPLTYHGNHLYTVIKFNMLICINEMRGRPYQSGKASWISLNCREAVMECFINRVESHLNEGQIAQHHPPLLRGAVHLARVGLRTETTSRHRISQSRWVDFKVFCKCISTLHQSNPDKCWWAMIKVIMNHHQWMLTFGVELILKLKECTASFFKGELHVFLPLLTEYFSNESTAFSQKLASYDRW